MEKIRVLIVEDKLLIAEDIAGRLKKHSLDVVNICTTGEDAIEKVQKDKPDLILMDIELAGAMDGISTAQVILQQQFIPIIYLSDYTDPKTVERAIKTHPASYLSKPFHEADLIRAIDIAFHNARQMTGGAGRFKDLVFLRTDTQVYVKQAVSSILYLEADRSYCSVITDLKTYKLSTNMSHVYEQLNHEDFVKVHRSYIVNVNRITELKGNVIMLGSREVQMSKEYRDNLLSILKIIK